MSFYLKNIKKQPQKEENMKEKIKNYGFYLQNLYRGKVKLTVEQAMEA